MNCTPSIEIQETVVAIAESECDRPIEIIVEGVRVIDPIGGDGATLVFNEIPVGAIDGINATFMSQNPFVPGSLMVYLNGFRQKLVDDFQSVGNTTIVFLIAPLAGENLTIDYQRV